MTRLALLVAVFAMAGCGLEKAGADPFDAGSDVGRPDVAKDVTSDGPPVGCESKLCPDDQFCKSGACAYPTSCKEVFDNRSDVVAQRHNSNYAISSTDTLYCNMDDFGGGWTLVARTVPGGTGSMGWSTALGDAVTPSKAYALDVLTRKIAFTEGMLGATKGNSALSAPVITFTFPAPFTNFSATGGKLGAVTVQVPANTCAKTDVPAGLIFAGYTKRTDVFFFSDVDLDVPFGVGPSGFFTQGGTGSSSCVTDQFLAGSQVLLFVR